MSNKKYKMKKKTVVIFLICLVLVSITIISSINENKYKNKNSIRENERTNSNNDEKQKNGKDIKLEKLENIDKKIKYFNYNYIDRYIAYKELNKNLDIKDIITRVNIGIDQDYYTNTKKTPYLNKPYILLNKYNYADSYVPDNLVELDTKYARSGMMLVDYAKKAFEEMASDAKKENLNIIAMSSYRSYSYQVNLYNKYKNQDGEEAADTYSARAGYSEHQTGLAVDIYNGKINYTDFEKTKEYNWMQENAYKYGFILRFPKDKTDLTGYMYESWHYRYVGTEAAKYIKENNLCFEEYYVQKIENQM